MTEQPVMVVHFSIPRTGEPEAGESKLRPAEELGRQPVTQYLPSLYKAPNLILSNSKQKTD